MQYLQTPSSPVSFTLQGEAARRAGAWLEGRAGVESRPVCFEHHSLANSCLPLGVWYKWCGVLANTSVTGIATYVYNNKLTKPDQYNNAWCATRHHYLWTPRCPSTSLYQVTAAAAAAAFTSKTQHGAPQQISNWNTCILNHLNRYPQKPTASLNS